MARKKVLRRRKLTPEQILKIHYLSNGGSDPKDIAREMGLFKNTVKASTRYLGEYLNPNTLKGKKYHNNYYRALVKLKDKPAEYIKHSKGNHYQELEKAFGVFQIAITRFIEAEVENKVNKKIMERDQSDLLSRVRNKFNGVMAHLDN